MDLNDQYKNYTTVPMVKTDDRENTDTDDALFKDYEIREQDRWLPLANGEYSVRSLNSGN